MSGPTDPVEAHFDKGTWGWDLTQWRKLPMLWGYSDRYAERLSDTTMPAGNSNLTGTAVPAGEVWRVTGLALLRDGATCTQMRVHVNYGGTIIEPVNVLNPTANQLYPFVTDFTLKAGDYLYCRYYGMTLNDDAYLHIWGYKMAIAE